MAVVIPINSQNAIQNSDGKTYSQFEYKFPDNVNFSNKQVQVNSIVVPFSWFNVTARFQNNVFQITWIDGTTATVTMPDGNYSVSDINLFLQQFMIQKTWYTINNAGSANQTNNYYLALAENPVYYAVQLSSLNVPTAAQAAAAGITLPAGATWTFPVATANPQFIIPTFTANTFNTSFSQLLGFLPQTWPTAQTPGSIQSILSNFTPNLNPVATTNLLCDLIFNPYSSNSTTIISFSMSDTAFGSNYQQLVSQDTWYMCRSGNFSGFRIRVVDQTLNVPVFMNDVSSFSLQLSVQDAPPIYRDQKYRITAV